MLVAALVTFIWLLGIVGFGFLINQKMFRFNLPRSFVLAYPTGLLVIGISAWSLWLANVPFHLIYSGFYIVVLASLFWLSKQNHFSIRTRLMWFEQLKKLVTKAEMGYLEIIMLLIIFPAIGLIVLWLLLTYPVVWDSLALYDFRAKAIADGWQLADFGQQFLGHARFAGYDFSHPFGASIWQAFLHKSGWERSGIVYIAWLISLVLYARIIWSKTGVWLIFLMMLFATKPLQVVWTQVYTSLPNTLVWLTLFLFIIDTQKQGLIKPLRPASSIINLTYKLFLIVGIIFTRVSEPFWLIMFLWVLFFDIYYLSAYKFSKYKLLAVAFFSLAIPLIWFNQWQSIQLEVVIINTSTTSTTALSSYDWSKYAGISTIFNHSEWWLQAMTVWLVKNPASSYLGLITLLLFYSRRCVTSSLVKWLFLGLLMMGTLYFALVFEISREIADWANKGRLLERASLPIVAWSVVMITELVAVVPELTSRHKKLEE